MKVSNIKSVLKHSSAKAGECVTFIQKKVSQLYFSSIKSYVELLSRYNCRSLAVSTALFAAEFPAMIRSGYFTIKKALPEKQTVPIQNGSRPIILIHGAIGSSHYLQPLANKLQEKGLHVYPLHLGTLDTTNEKIASLIEEISTVLKCADAEKVDIVSHSMGSYLALEAALKDSRVQKLVTLAMPIDSDEQKRIASAQKCNDIFSITAKNDVIMSHKANALNGRQTVEVNAGHVGIVFHKNTPCIISEIVSK